jgi:tetratricopeptide (TPR) repeat protein
MIHQNNLELRGSLSSHPLAELLLEASHVKLTGSFKLEEEARKAVVYLRDGTVVFAAANERKYRLSEMLARSGAGAAFGPQTIGDVEFGRQLISKGILSEAKLDEALGRQADEIIRAALRWESGAWIFSPLVRAKSGVAVPVKITALLVEYARSLSDQTVTQRFKSGAESFGLTPDAHQTPIILTTRESFILSRFENSFLRVSELRQMISLSDTELYRGLYVLWLGGCLFRQNWQSPFTHESLSRINSARLEIRKAESLAQKEIMPRPEVPAIEPPIKVSVKPAADTNQALRKYLERVEEAATHYEVLDVGIQAEVSRIKQSYFNLAKQFHPDRFHKEADGALLQRIQSAFSKIAQAYETLKDESARELYNFKLRKKLAELEVDSPAADAHPEEQPGEAREVFERGYSLLMEDDLTAAIPFLARAASMAPDVARYHAFYGKALAADASQFHKAESEMQIAVKLDPNSSTFRLVLAEFFIDVGLIKRAEGELQRLLKMFPGNREAQSLLDSLKNK